MYAAGGAVLLVRGWNRIVSVLRSARVWGLLAAETDRGGDGDGGGDGRLRAMGRQSADFPAAGYAGGKESRESAR